MLRLLPLVALVAAPAASAQFAFTIPTDGGGRARAVDVAPSGAVTFAGEYSASSSSPSNDFDPGPAVVPGPAGRGGFVARYTAGGALEWLWAATADRFDGIGADVRPGGGAVVAGHLVGSLDVDPAPDRTQTVSAVDGLAVVALTASGDVEWAFAVGEGGLGGAVVRTEDVAVDAAGNVYVAGYLAGPGGTIDVDPGPGEATLRVSGSPSSFVASYDAGGAYRWAFVLGSESGSGVFQNRALGIAADAGGVYVTGFFKQELDLDPGPGGRVVTAPPTSSADQGYVARYDPATGALDWAASFGDRRSDRGLAVAPDGVGGAFVSGTLTRPRATFNQPEFGGLFVGRFGAGGGTRWTVTSGTARPRSSDVDAGFAVAYDGAGRVAVGGTYYATQDFGGPDSFGQPSGAGPNDGQAFVAVLDAETGTFVEATSLGGPDPGFPPEEVRALAWEGGEVVVGGAFRGTLTPPGGPRLTADWFDPFLARFSVSGTAPPPLLVEVAVQERIAVTDVVDLAAALRLLVREVVGVTDEADFRRSLALLVQERIGVVDEAALSRALTLLIRERVGVADGFAYDLTEAVACAVGLPLGVGAFDADGTDPTFGEYAEVVSGADRPVDLSTCSLVAINPFAERVTYSASPDVAVLDRVVFATQGGDVTAPPGWLPDGPGAIVLVEGAAPVGTSVQSIFGRVLSAVVYLRDGQVFGRSGYAGAGGARTSSVYGDLAEVLAAIQGDLPDEVSLALAGPNPVRQGGAVAVGLPEGGAVRVSVFDLLGREVARPLDAELAAGLHTVALDVGALPSGAYVVRLMAGGEVRVVRVTVAR